MTGNGTKPNRTNSFYLVGFSFEPSSSLIQPHLWIHYDPISFPYLGVDSIWAVKLNSPHPVSSCCMPDRTRSHSPDGWWTAEMWGSTGSMVQPQATQRNARASWAGSWAANSDGWSKGRRPSHADPQISDLAQLALASAPRVRDSLDIANQSRAPLSGADLSIPFPPICRQPIAPYKLPRFAWKKNQKKKYSI